MSVLKNRISEVLQDLSGEADQSDIDQAAAAFEADMKPVCNAVVEALQSGDLHALRGLRALLPTLLEEVNQSPALADVLAHQMGAAVLKGFNAKPDTKL